MVFLWNKMRAVYIRHNFILYTVLWVAVILNLIYLLNSYIGLHSVETVVTSRPSTDQSEATTVSVPVLKQLVRCMDRSQAPFMEQRGQYLVYYNYIRATSNFSCHDSVTLTTHGEAYYVLENLETLVERWGGPISVSVFTLKEDYDLAVKVITYLRECKSQLIKELVTFHFIFQERHFPTKILKPANISAISIFCSSGTEESLRKKSYRSGSHVTYPVNVARNAARKAATTYFVLPSDIELYPSYNFTTKFLSFIRRNPGYVDRQPVGVFVIPIFEVASNVSVPNNKTELVSLLSNGSAVVFHELTCPECQTFPGLESWKRREEEESLSVVASAKRQGRFRSWEPIYVGTHKQPYYDERLSWEGTKDKMVQMYLLCLMNYDFLVLDNAFLVHRPGIKNKEEVKQETWRTQYKDAQVKLVDKEIKEEYDKIYGSRWGCQM